LNAKPKHTPIRTCVACRNTDEKRDLLRVVRQPDGTVIHDPKGKLSGRGAYVCASAECIALARKQKRLERSLKVSGLTDELFAVLIARAAVVDTAGQAGRMDGTTPVPSASGPQRAQLVAPQGQESEAENA
jgi:hypothetical protein